MTNINLLATIDLEALNVLTFNPAFSGLSMVLDLMTSLQPLVIAGEFSFDFVAEIDFVAVDWTMELPDLFSAITADIELPDIIVPEDIFSNVEITFDFSPAQELASSFFDIDAILALDIPDFDLDLSGILPSIQIFLQDLTVDGMFSIAAIRTEIMR